MNYFLKLIANYWQPILAQDDKKHFFQPAFLQLLAAFVFY
jgi:hypothetical protein